MTASDIVNEDSISLGDVCPIETLADFRHNVNAMSMLLSYWLEHQPAFQGEIADYARMLRDASHRTEGLANSLLGRLCEQQDACLASGIPPTV